jgi:hypothetical protein
MQIIIRIIKPKQKVAVRKLATAVNAHARAKVIVVRVVKNPNAAKTKRDVINQLSCPKKK